MQFLRTFLVKKLKGFTSAEAKRKYAQVHDITIKANDQVLGSMERNGEIVSFVSVCFRGWAGVGKR